MADEEEYGPVSPPAEGSGVNTPLLGDSEQGLNLKRPPTPLPLTQMLLLMVVRLAEPVASTQIFPYINGAPTSPTRGRWMFMVFGQTCVSNWDMRHRRVRLGSSRA